MPNKKAEVPVNCPKCKGGVLFDVSSRLGVAIGLKQVKCDKCGYQKGYKLWSANGPASSIRI